MRARLSILLSLALLLLLGPVPTGSCGPARSRSLPACCTVDCCCMMSGQGSQCCVHSQPTSLNVASTPLRHACHPHSRALLHVVSTVAVEASVPLAWGGVADTSAGPRAPRGPPAQMS